MQSNILNQMFNPSISKQWTKITEDFSVDEQTSFQMGKHGKVYRGFSLYRNFMVAVKIVQKDEFS